MAFLQPSSSLSSRESFLEKKILILDKRLTSVEKFIESRFRNIERNASGDLSDNEDKPRSRSKRKGLKKTVVDVASPEKRGSSSSPFETERRKSEESSNTINNTSGHSKKRKKNRPGPASVKKKREEKAADKKSREKEKLKDCVVVLTKTEIPGPARVTRANNTDDKVEIVKTSSGRARKTPKRYEEEDYEDFGTPKRSKRSSRRLGDDGIKVEEEDEEEMVGTKAKGSETPVAIILDHGEEDGGSDEDNGQGDYDSYYDVDGPNSPAEGAAVGDKEEEDGGGGNYFNFLKSPPRSTVTGVGSRNKEDDEDWDTGGDHGAEEEDDTDDEDDEGEVETSEEKSPVKRGRGRPRGTKGKFTKIKKEKKSSAKKPAAPEEIVKKVRKFVSVPLAEFPTEMLSSADPSVKLCELCKRHIKNELFENHLESHAKERHLKCTQCDKAYFNTYMLKKHMRVHEPEKYAKKCRQCGKQFIQMDKLLGHERFCVKRALEKNQFVDPNLIEDLKKRSKGNPSWIEEIKGMEEDTASTISGNTPGSSSSERKQCPHCNKNFKADFFEKHLKGHNKEKSWSCKECDKSYHYKHDLVRHVTLEHVADPKCEFCGESFQDRKLLKEHRTPCRRMYKKEELKIRKVTSLVKTREENNDEEEEMVKEEDDYKNSSGQQDTDVMEVEVGETIVGGPIVIEEVSIIDGDYEDEDEDGTHHITLGLVTAGD